MAAERKTKLSKNLLRMKVRGRRGGGWGNRGTWASGPGRGSGGRRRRHQERHEGHQLGHSFIRLALALPQALGTGL